MAIINGKVVKQETADARRLYLWGNGGGKPIRNLRLLAKESGVSETTLQRHAPEWNKEAEEMARNSSGFGLGVALSEGAWERFNDDRDWLEIQKDKLKIEYEQAEECHEELFDMLRDFRSGFGFDEQEFAKLQTLIGNFCRTVKTRDGIMAQFLKVRAVWEAASGLGSHLKAASTLLNEQAKQRSKVVSPDEEQERDVTPDKDEKRKVFRK